VFPVSYYILTRLKMATIRAIKKEVSDAAHPTIRTDGARDADDEWGDLI